MQSIAGKRASVARQSPKFDHLVPPEYPIAKQSEVFGGHAMQGNTLYRLACLFVTVPALASMTGCCASPYRAYQNAYGFNCPLPEYFDPTVRPQRTTPPGPISPAAWPAPAEVAN
jgi:hypothetical protein